MRSLATTALLLLVALGTRATARPFGRPSSLPPGLAAAVDLGRAPAAERHRVVVGLDLRNRDALESFLAGVQDLGSPTYQRFLTQDEFDALYGPTPDEEAAVVAHLEGHGLTVTRRFPNRLLVVASGPVSALERAFGVEIHHVQYRGARHYAAVTEPSFPADLDRVITGVVGLDDLEAMRPRVGSVEPAVAPHAMLGSNCCHFSPNDTAAFYDDARTADGTGQTIVIAGAFAWRDTDNTTFNTQWGLPQLPAGSGQICTGAPTSTGCRFSTQNSIEIALDVEYSHGVAPGARILNYMTTSTALTDFTTMYNQVVTDNPGHVVSTSWGACEALVAPMTQQMDDDIFANANAIGQAWFAASGDNGSRDCGTAVVSVDNPANSPHVMGVGGTTPTCSGGLTTASPACGGYRSETAWSGSGGGVSQLFLRPAFQTGCGIVPGAERLVPDVALAANSAPGYYVLEGGSWFIVGGTSAAAPQWAGYLAQLVQRRGGASIGNPGGLLYGLCGTAAFHDVTSGSNTDFTAGAGYDLVTGLGTVDASQLLALASPPTTTTSSTTTSSTSTTTSSTTTTSTTTTSSTTTATTSTTTSTTASTTTSSTTTSSTTTTSSSTTSATTSSTTSSTTSTTVPPPTTTSSSTTSSSTTATTTTSTSTSSTTTTTLAPVTVSFRSIAAEDGSLGESSPGSGVGGAAIATATTMQVGDQATNAQSKVLASFDTSTIPAGATIVSATLRLNRVSLVGANPFDTLGRLLADVQAGAFGGDATLQASDFQAAATAAATASLSNPTTNGSWSTGTLGPAGLAAINRTGRTQVRLAFEVHDNGNGIADRIAFATGDNADATVRPELDVTYVPASADTTTTTTTAPTTTTTSTTASSTTTSTSSTTTTTLGGGSPVTVSFRSIAAEDGSLGESSAGSGVGGAAISTATTMQVGDQVTNAQSKVLASFDTSTIPAGATIVSATLRFNRVSLVGANPFDTLGRLLADVQTGAFGADATLQPSDFQAAATAPGAASLGNPTTNGAWSTGTLGPAGLAAINRTGRTQVRLAFEVHDNGNAVADRIAFATGDNADPSLRPELDVSYVP